MTHFWDIYLLQGDDAYRFTPEDISSFVEDPRFVREVALFTDKQRMDKVRELRVLAPS